VRSRHVDVDYAEVFGGEPTALRARPSPAPYGVAADDRPSAIQAREDAAIERALAAYRDRAAEPAATPRPAPIATAPRATGFGRKGL
jgi:hypothetical protein